MRALTLCLSATFLHAKHFSLHVSYHHPPEKEINIPPPHIKTNFRHNSVIFVSKIYAIKSSSVLFFPAYWGKKEDLSTVISFSSMLHGGNMKGDWDGLAGWLAG